MSTIIDLRSDTVTKPTPEMMEYVMKAVTGDDVFGEDPTVNAFQLRIANMFGKEAGLFVPSGVMSNQLALSVLGGVGEEVLTEENAHIFNYETAAASHLSSLQIRPIKGKNGKLYPELLEGMVRGNFDWEPDTTILSLENTANRGGGYFYSKSEMQDLKQFADTNGLHLHMDGARIWNAHIASGIPFSFFGEIAETISVCFSKGLGAPAGSMLLGSTEIIKKARRFRKMWGGGMRQVGLLAAAAEFAFDNNLVKMQEDHRRAGEFGKAILEHPLFDINPDSIQTNILIFDVLNGRTAAEICEYFKSKDILMIPFGEKRIRSTFHYQVNDDGLTKAIEVLKSIA